MSFSRTKRLTGGGGVSSGSGDQGPLSLLTLIQSRAAPRSRPVIKETPLGHIKETPLGQYDPSAADDQDLYRLPGQYQSQPADLSLHSDDTYDPPNLFFRPPAPYDGGYYGGPGYDPATDPGGHYQDYADYYPRPLYPGYDDTGDRIPPYPGPELEHDSYRYPEPSIGQYPPMAAAPLLPPPLHPSPAVLLHIKYVMESVCESMCFTDVTIITANDTLRAHRSILSAHSSFLNYLLNTEQEDPVIFFPTYSSLYVRMLLQFFYTGEVTSMTQRDIEPLREICYSLGITSLMTRLDDVKLSISFQNIPSYDTHIPSVDHNNSSQDETKQPLSDPLADDPPQLQPPPPEPDPLDHDVPPPLVTSCKYQEQRDKPKLHIRDSLDDMETRRYTVVSKMPKNTNLQVSTKCPKCELKFFKEDQLKEHMRIHDGLKPKECHICKKSFNTNYHLKTHMRIHTGDKPYVCIVPDCGKDFSDSSSLRRHQQTHTGTKPYACKDCDKAFSDRSSLKRHRMSHNPEDAYHCSYCSKTFTRKLQLKTHETNVHSLEKKEWEPLVPQLFECHECKAVFKIKSLLDQHSKVHTGEKSFKCDKCEKMFSRKSNLQLHMRTHTGEKPHACARCGRCFSDVSAFRRHCRTHSGERPYSCNDCGARFTQAATFNKHKTTCERRRKQNGENK